MYSNVTPQQHAEIIKEILALRSKVKEAKCITVKLSNRIDRGVNFGKSTDFACEQQRTLANYSLNSLMNNEVLNVELLRNDYSQLSSKLLNQMLDNINNQLHSASF